jgi:hypothetical protein
MSKEYFECAGVLLVVYGVFRVVIGLQLRNDFKPRPPSEPSNIQSHPIDTSPLAHRLEEVRQDYATEAHAHPASAKTPLLVEQRRAEMAKLAFFQKPPPAPEPPEQEPRLMLLTL